MIGLDTNVLVRYVMQDDLRQAQQATRLVESLSSENPGFVSLVALVEFVWVLESCFGLDRAQLTAAVEGVLRTQELVVEHAEMVWKAVRLYRAGSADFADHVIERSAASAGCGQTMTFDQRAAKTGGMTLLK